MKFFAAAAMMATAANAASLRATDGSSHVAPVCCAQGTDKWASCTKNKLKCDSDCRGWAPGFNVTGVSCVASASCKDVPDYAEGSICTCDVDDTVVVHGNLDDNHCEELFMPGATYKKFWADQGYKYADYKKGMCPAPYTSYDDRVADANYPEVTHVKRGLDGATAKITTTSCGGTFTWSAGTATKGGSVVITGTGDASGVTGGSYFIDAAYGSISLVNKKADMGQTLSADIKVLLTNFGTVTVTPFGLPGTNNAKVTINMPVPNIGGTVTGTSMGQASDGSQAWCLSLAMEL